MQFVDAAMETGKSTLALQVAHIYQARYRHGLLLTMRRRAGAGRHRQPAGQSSARSRVTHTLNLFDPIASTPDGDIRPVDHVVLTRSSSSELARSPTPRTLPLTDPVVVTTD